MGSIEGTEGDATADRNGTFRGGMEPIAIIGMATRFPQDATTTENLWKFLLEGRNAYSPFPEDRIDARGHYHPDPEHGGTVSQRRRRRPQPEI
jgi:acyl transferase domain-containing protein